MVVAHARGRCCEKGCLRGVALKGTRDKQPTNLRASAALAAAAAVKIGANWKQVHAGK